MHSVLIDGIEYVPRAEVPELTDTRPKLPQVGWLWTMHMEFDQEYSEFVSLGDDRNPHGVPGVDHDLRYTVTRTAVYGGHGEVISQGIKT